MIPIGRGMYIWQIRRCGNVVDIAKIAFESGLKHVLIKIADGINPYNIYEDIDWAKKLADELKAREIESWGWQYSYGIYPVLEAQIASRRIDETGVIGFIIDAESEYKDHPDHAISYCTQLRKLKPSFPIGLCSYRFPSIHYEFPWNEFRKYCDFDMPQVYWVGSHNPYEQLIQSYNEFNHFDKIIPFIPTGWAYKYERPPYYQPTIEEIYRFKQCVNDLGLFGYNFWEWYDARFIMPEIWDAINGNEGPEPPSPPDKVKVNVLSLNIRSSPIVDSSTQIGTTTYGKVWEVEASTMDCNGRVWYRVGKSAYIAGWLCKT